MPDLTKALDLDDCREELRRLQSAFRQRHSENLAMDRQLGPGDFLNDFQVLIEDQARRLDLILALLSWRSPRHCACLAQSDPPQC